jgi:myosin heavy subunit
MSYKMLAKSGCVKLENMDDHAEFKAVVKAMGTIGVAPDTQSQIWRVLAAILNMGEIDFSAKKADTGGLETSDVDPAGPIKTVCDLLKIDVDTLVTVLTSRAVTTGVSRRASTYSVPLVALAL